MNYLYIVYLLTIKNHLIFIRRYFNTLLLLKEIVAKNSLRINIGRGFVENEQAIVPQDGPGQTYELSLTDAEVVTAVEDIVVQRDVVQLDLSQHLPQLHVIVLIERVQIVAQTLGEEHWFLRYDGDLAAQLVLAYRARVPTVDLNLALQALVKKTEER